MKGFCRNDIICGIHLQRIKPKVSAAVCQWFFCGTTADMTPLTTWKKRKLVHGQRSVFRSEKCRHRVKPAIFCRGRFQFLDENSTCFSHRQSGGLRHGFAFLELLCTKIRDKRKPLGCAADPEVFARAEGSSWRKQNFRHEGLAAVLLDDIYTHVCRLNFLTKIAPVFARAVRGDVARNWLVGLALPRACFCFPHPIRLWDFWMIVVWEGNTARFGGITASAFAGICALSYQDDRPFCRTS